MNILVIIFSKDRPLQLDSLIRSIQEHVICRSLSIHVLYKASTQEFFAGYEKLQAMNYCSGMLRWHKEKNFKADLIALLELYPSAAHCMFLVDDDIFFRRVDIDFLLDSFTRTHLFISLRLSRNYKKYPRPAFLRADASLSWKWFPLFHKRSGNGWYYPFSVDGNIFHLRDIRYLLNTIDFSAPNSLEGEMHAHRKKLRFLIKPYALAPSNAVLFNNPLNKVQAEGETAHRNISPESLNVHFLSGDIIDNNYLYSADPDDFHFHRDIRFIPFQSIAKLGCVF